MAMVKNPFNGNLNSNEIFSAIYNMIISQQVFADNVSGLDSSLVTKVRTDGSMYGDTKLFYATDALESHAWGNDSEAANLLAINRPAAPKCQAITLDQFRQIDITVDNYLTKRAWSTEGAFSDFNSVVLGWVRETKKIYDVTLINVYHGTVTTGATRAVENIDLTTALTGLSGIEKDRKQAEEIAYRMANLLTELKDVNRDFNEYGFIRSYSPSDFYVVWNADYVNKIRKMDLPTIFHKDGLVDKFDEEQLPAKYFGTLITSSNIGSYSASTPAAGKPIDSDDSTYTPGTNHANGTLRSAIEAKVTVGGTAYHLFPGDELPAGATVGSGKQFGDEECYIVDSKIICKLVHKDSIKFMSAFEVGTMFFNPRSLTENHYLTWGYSKPDYLKNYPIITVKEI